MVREKKQGIFFGVVAEKGSYLEINLVALGQVQVRGSGNMFKETEAREKSSYWGLGSAYEQERTRACSVLGLFRQTPPLGQVGCQAPSNLPGHDRLHMSCFATV